MRDQRLQHAGIAPTAVPVDSDNTPSQFSQQFVDMSTPSPSSHHVRPGAGRLNPQRAVPHRPPPPGVPSKTTGFVDMTNQQYVTVHPSGNSRRRRPNVDALLRSSIMSGTASLSSSQIKSIGMPPANADVVSVPILGDCAFEQKYSIRFSQDHDTAILQDSMTPMARLTMLRDAMGSISKPNGYIDRATFSQAFEVQENDFEGYNNDHGYVDGHAFLIDAVMELDVSAEEKLKFIFDTLDTERMGTISIEQVEKLLESNFSNAKLEIVGMDMKTVAGLLFRKANAREGCMNYTQFRSVFQGYVTGSFGLDKANDMTSNKSVRAQASRSKFSMWYDNNKIRIWWLVIYAIANNLAFWLKWHAYKVDPALGYGLRIARGCAQVAMLNVMLLFMPMLRSITQVMKRSRLLWRYIPFDDHIEAHKICGSVCLIAGIIHTLAHVSNEIHLYLIATPDEIQRSVFVERKVKAFENGLPPFSVMLQAIPVWTGVILIVITAISFPLAAFPKLRGGNFNVFWYSHMLFGVFLFVLCFHGATSWLAHASSYWWVGPPFALYLIERRFRYAKMFAAPVRILEAVELEQTCAVFMEKPRRFVYRPGMYLFINCPTISTHEWHPFTISSAPGDNYVSIHMRKAGDWTGAFHKLIADCHANKKEYPAVYLDGPVGAPTQDYHRYSTVICVGGGIGVTPFASILKDVVHLWEEYRCRNCKHVRHPSSFQIQKLYFHWTTRAQESLMWFEKTMNQITAMDRDNIIEAHQYLTTVKDGDNTSQLKMFQQFVHDQTGRDIVSGLKSKMLTHFGRPDWDQVFQDARRAHPGEEIGVFFCGPHPLEKVLDEMCKKYSDPTPGGTVFDYHSEKFA